MNRNSLRLRLVASGVIAILAALAVAGAGLTLLFERHVGRTLEEDLDVHLNQLLSGLDVDPGEGLVVNRPPADPRFSDPLSGLYWQVSTDAGQVLRSRSLWDTMLSVPADDPPPGEVHHHGALGANNARMLIAERLVRLTVAERRTPVRVVVAVDLARVTKASSAFAKDLAAALALLGLVLAVATSAQVVLGLRPLDRLRRGIADIRSGRAPRLPSGMPSEVEPLVEEVNGLLDAQDREIERSRGRAADLAHGLKTPLAALAADAGRLRECGQQVIAGDIEAVGEAMSRHIDRELALARVRGRARSASTVSTDIGPLVKSLIATLVRTPPGRRIAFEERVPDGLRLGIDRTDLAEVLGNLLDNAVRHARTRVRIACRSDPGGASVAVEDDGSGIPASARSDALRRGVRLDERGEGTGLGLAIVQDVLEAYDWRLDLAASELGGLKAEISPHRLFTRQEPGAGAPIASALWFSKMTED